MGPGLKSDSAFSLQTRHIHVALLKNSRYQVLVSENFRRALTFCRFSGCEFYY